MRSRNVPTRTPSVLDRNLAQFDEAYRSSGALAGFVRTRLSFDQQYKLKINWRLLKPYIDLRPINRVLEIGFGFGLALRRLPKHVAVCGTEISPNAVRGLETAFARQGRRASLVVHDSSGPVPFDGSFDVILCSHVLEHLGDDEGALRGFAGLLASGGVLLINVPINERIPDPKHQRPYDLPTLTAKIEAAGLKVVAHVEADRWANCFAHHDDHRPAWHRILRALLALLPLSTGEWLADRLCRGCPRGQLAVLAVGPTPTSK